ncbi:MAG: hypothetical protein U5K99_08645 [Anaerolineales bacterium]|nr:hypothetical protein [Anaerolineales bacterium]
MKTKRMALLSIFLIATLVLSGLSTTFALAAESLDDPEKVEITGTIKSIDEDGLFFVEVEDEKGNLVIYTIEVGEEFDFESISIGDEIELEGLPTKDELIFKMTKYKLEERERVEDGYFCDAEKTEDDHPVAVSIAETYKVEYQTIMDWFCGGDGEEGSNATGFGNIMLALHTAEISDKTVEEIMEYARERSGLGSDLAGRSRRIWKT